MNRLIWTSHIDSEIKELIEKEFNRCIDQYPNIHSSEISIKFNKRMRSVAGRAINRKSTKKIIKDIAQNIKQYDGYIELNPNLLINKKDILQTFVHELCHILCYKIYGPNISHGKTWKNMMKKFGYDPNIYHSFDVKSIKRKFERVSYVCGCSTHKITKIKLNRIKKGYTYYCIKCKEILKPPKRE